MSEKSDQRILLEHANAVVRNTDEPTTGLLDFDENLAGARVDGIFDQFLDHGRGSLHHLAGGDLVHDMIWKYFDSCWHKYRKKEPEARKKCCKAVLLLTFVTS